MNDPIRLPSGSIGRFAIVKLWPELKTAEDECIARLKIAAKDIGVECVEVYADGSFREQPDLKVSRNNVDFVLHLHYDTPKNYDAFSFVALWNPLSFYHEWGYLRCSRNLLSHDDFFSCSSTVADDHVARMVRNSKSHLPPQFNLYHSLSDIMFPPSLGEKKLFYVGINWEAISGTGSRHQEVLKSLDKTGLLNIYGPKVFQGVQVWAGYKSYVKEIPFDGVSMIKEIARTGISLVLSSSAHRESELMSNRLFESIAAGSLIICDENPFGKKFFGDNLLYIDSRSSVPKMEKDIFNHIQWARNNPDEALAKITRCQEIFRQEFSLKVSLTNIYNGFEERKKALSEIQNPSSQPSPSIRCHFLMPEFSIDALNRHIESAEKQIYDKMTPVLVTDLIHDSTDRKKIQTNLKASSLSWEWTEISVWDIGNDPEQKSRRPLGKTINQAIEESRESDAFMVVAPNESLFSNHLQVLAGALQHEPKTNCVATAAILHAKNRPIHDVHEVIDFNHVNPNGPCGYGRFLFRVSAIPLDIRIALDYLHGRPLAALVGTQPISQQFPATISIDLQIGFPDGRWNDSMETEILRAYNPESFKVIAGPKPFHLISQFSPPHPTPPSFTVSNLLKCMLKPSWHKAQYHKLRKQGFKERLSAFQRKMGWSS